MKLWIARTKGGFKKGYLDIFENKPVYIKHRDEWIGSSVKVDINNEEFPEVTFENSPQEVEISLHHSTTKPLTRDYFANHNWEIIIPEPDENGFVLWEARWIRSMEKGSPYYSDITVTNMMYEDRFCISGKTGEGNVEYLMAYTEKDLENILKVLDIYDYYKKEVELKLL
jgi:hypothetical protein